MISKISAEFDSIDTAEAAARSIKSKFDGITRIIINNKNNFPATASNNSGIFSSGVTGLFFPFGNGYQNVTGFVPLEDSNYYSESTYGDNVIETGREAMLEIHCEQESIRGISQHIIALGGLQVKK